MNDPLISVIVPVYNTGEVLNQTIESIAKQTYTNFELLLIDDGSTDKSGEICDDYAKKDKRVQVFHKKNGGICSARNFGLEKAKGDYITFCDHDDLYNPDLLKREISIATLNNADMVVVGRVFKSDDGKSAIFGADYIADKDYIARNFCKMYNLRTFDTVWNVLYKRDIVGLTKFDTKYKYGHEDITFNLDVISNVHLLVSVKEVLYTHVIRGSLSTSAKLHTELIDAMIGNNNNVYNKILSFEHSPLPNVRDYEKVQGELMKSCLVYSVKCGVSYNSFTKIAKQLKFIPNLMINRSIDKDIFVFNLVNKKQYSLLFLIFKLNAIFKS